MLPRPPFVRSTGDKLIPLRAVPAVDGGQPPADLAHVDLEVVAQSVQCGVKVPQLGIEVTEQNHRVLGKHRCNSPLGKNVFV